MEMNEQKLNEIEMRWKEFRSEHIYYEQDIPALIAALRAAWGKIETMKDGMEQCK